MSTYVPERPPGFLAACLAAAGAHPRAALRRRLAQVARSGGARTGLVFSGDPSGATLRLLLPWLLLLAAQPFLAAWIVRQSLQLFDAGDVTYARACAAMVVGLVVTVLAAAALPAGAAVPVLGYAWAGALAAAALLARPH